VPLFLAVAAITVVGAGGAFALTRPPTPPPAPPAAAKSATIEPVIAKAPPAPTEAPSPTDLALRRMKVVILPGDAQTEIEGEKAQVKLGVLEIAGVLGTRAARPYFQG
jgi:hypothetical protein